MTSIHPITNYSNTIDSRDVISRIGFLERVESALDEDEKRELAALRALADDGETNVSGWQYGETLIRESYFVRYCKEILNDCGDLPRDLPPYIVIDWEATARNIRDDYTELTFDGVTYLARS
jgi:hypothetical protein